MFKNKVRLLLYILFFFVCMKSYAQKQDSIQFSLLTCSPGTEIYSLFGHTAIRYQNFTQNRDLVFNYGMFSFSAPNFIYRFVKGETDYQLGVTEYSYFESEYKFRGSAVYQQVINLTQVEKLNLQRLLLDNYLPQNRVYRYNYFYDNCTTRARDRIEQSINGRVVYPDASEDKTFRSIIHEYTKGFQWEELGIDLCLGAEADENISIRQQMFSPFYMYDFAQKAVIESADGNVRPFVSKEEIIVEAGEVEGVSSFPLGPVFCSIIFLLINLIVIILQIRGKRIFWWWDLFLYLIQGVSGCIIAFLFFFSVHPTVGSNWMILLLNPIPLVYLPFMVYNDIKHKKDRYHIINLAYLTLFILLMPLMPQNFNISVLPLACGFWCNALGHVIVYKKWK